MIDFEKEIQARRERENKSKSNANTEKRLNAALLAMVNSREGRLVLKHILFTLSKIDEDTYSNDALYMAQQCGVRTVGLSLKSQIINTCGIKSFRAIEDEVE